MMSIDNRLEDRGREHDMLDYLALFWRWRRWFMINMIILLAVGIAVAFLIPRWYLATASILPPREQGVLSQLGAASSMLRSITGNTRLPSGLSGSSNSYNYLAILKSRSTMEEVVRRFDLRIVYDVADSSMDKAVAALEENTSFDIQPEDNITIEVYDRDARRAADMANGFVEILNATSLRLSTQEARNNREFIEQRLALVKEDLRRAEESLRKYQESSGLILVPTDKASGLESVVELYALKAQKELELSVLRRTMSDGDPSIRRLSIELQEIRRAVDSLPKQGMESLRLYREFMIQQRILEFVVPLYEQAKVDEKKDVPVLLVLDAARAPERPEKPRRLILVVAILVSGLLFSAFSVLFFESYRRSDGTANPVAHGLQRFVSAVERLYRVRL